MRSPTTTPTMTFDWSSDSSWEPANRKASAAGWQHTHGEENTPSLPILQISGIPNTIGLTTHTLLFEMTWARLWHGRHESAMMECGLVESVNAHIINSSVHIVGHVCLCSSSPPVGGASALFPSLMRGCRERMALRSNFTPSASSYSRNGGLWKCWAHYGVISEK